MCENPEEEAQFPLYSSADAYERSLKFVLINAEYKCAESLVLRDFLYKKTFLSERANFSRRKSISIFQDARHI